MYVFITFKLSKPYAMAAANKLATKSPSIASVADMNLAARSVVRCEALSMVPSCTGSHAPREENATRPQNADEHNSTDTTSAEAIALL